jgi:hypothetical protein
MSIHPSIPPSWANGKQPRILGLVAHRIASHHTHHNTTSSHHIAFRHKNIQRHRVVEWKLGVCVCVIGWDMVVAGGRSSEGIPKGERSQARRYKVCASANPELLEFAAIRYTRCWLASRRRGLLRYVHARLAGGEVRGLHDRDRIAARNVAGWLLHSSDCDDKGVK